MKTGGTLNFLKRAGAILMVVAVFASSCNKYADDFKQLNTKLDGLTGAVALATDMTALKAQIAALQTAVAALPNPTASIATLTTNLATVSGNVDKISTALNTLASTAASKTDVTNAISAIKTELTTQLGVTNKAITDAQAKILAANDQQTKDIQKSIVDNNTTLAALIQAQIDALGTSINGTLTQQQTAINAMIVMLQAQQSQLAQILMNTSTLASNVTITSDAELDYWKKYLTVPSMINGTVKVDVTNITSTKQARLDSVLANVVSVFGGTSPQVNVTSSSALKVNLPNLTTVVGDMTANGALTIPQLTSVSGALSLNADGPYNLSNTLSVKDLNLTVYVPSASGVTPVVVGTTAVTLPNLTITGTLNGGGSVAFANAASIDLEGACTSLTVDKATSVNLHGDKHAGAFQLSAALATTVTDAAASCAGALTISADKATTVSMPNITTVGAGNAVSVITNVVSAVNLPKLATGGDVTINMGAANNGTVDLTAFKSVAAVTLVGPKTVTLPAYVSGLLTASQATSVTLAKHDGVLAPVLPAVTSLTMGALNAAGFDISSASYPALLTANITGKTAGTVASVTTGTTNTTMTGLTLVGPMVSANINDAQKLTSLATSGVINSVTLNSCDIITGVNFAHTHLIGGTGSVLKVTANPKLAALTTSTDFPAEITVTGNGSLKTLNLSSYTTKLFAAAGAVTNITISGNSLSGNYTKATKITPTSAYVETTINSADLNTLKAFVASYPATAPPALALAVDLDNVTLAGGTATDKLSARMNADVDHTTVNGASFNFGIAPGTPNTTGITIAKEFTLLQ